MKILYHHRIRSKDGQFVHIEELTSALKCAGHEIVLVGPGAVQSDKFGAEAGVVAWLKRRLPRFIYELLELVYAVVDYLRLVRAVKMHVPDCLYERYNLYLPSGVWAKRRFNLPMLLEVNAPLYEERKRYDGIALDRLAQWSESYTWRGADFVLPVTRVLAEYVERCGVSPERIAVIPNAIDPSRFGGIPDANAAKRALGLSGRFVLGFVGFMRQWHGLEAVIDLLADDRDAKRFLLLVGDGPARENLERHARVRGVSDQIRITGVIQRERIAEHIAAFDVALQPSVVSYASPLKLFEYLALGRAIVAPATRNLQEILVHEQNALLFDPLDNISFSRAIERLCRDDELRARLSLGATQTIADRRLTWADNAHRVAELFRRAGVKGDRDEHQGFPPVSLN